MSVKTIASSRIERENDAEFVIEIGIDGNVDS